MIKGVLFDIDGTLVLSNDAHTNAWQDAFAEQGYDVPFEKIRPLIGMGGDKLMSTLDPKLSDETGKGKSIAERRQEIFLTQYVHSLRPAPGSRDLVKAIKRAGLKTMIATSAKKQELDALLEAAQVADLLTEATMSDDAENSKPDPDIIHEALKKIGLKADEAVMLGDTPYDIEASARAGVACLALRCGGWTDSQLAGARGVYQNPADLIAHRRDIPSLLGY